jgi:hypothetical protein
MLTRTDCASTSRVGREPKSMHETRLGVSSRYGQATEEDGAAMALEEGKERARLRKGGEVVYCFIDGGLLVLLCGEGEWIE